MHIFARCVQLHFVLRVRHASFNVEIENFKTLNYRYSQEYTIGGVKEAIRDETKWACRFLLIMQRAHLR